MLGQVGLASKQLSAFIAGKRSFSTVYLRVRSEVILSSKGSIAVLACEGLFISVNTHMGDEMAPLGKRLPTLLANVRCPPHVAIHVSHELSLAFEELAAVAADERLLSRVNFGVFDATAYVGK